ncbi:hypothetical protein ABZ342_32515 [Amycolatopsis sp. NPDC005961]|uniref:hypothetical protein n=1 Tax=Amycolatopsis sp. NPDC005961 TaxID=3156720 RepID=UPI0033D4402B
MNAQVGSVIFDTNTLVNFAVVDRLDLLEVHYGYRALWTETVEVELQRGVSQEPKIRDILTANWLGDPVEILVTPDENREIDRIRRALGGTASLPLQHLGEAEIIFYMENRAPGAILITDDMPALDFAKNKGLTAINTANVLGECYSYSEIGCPHAYELLVEMRNKGRGVRVPADHSSVC